jgi:hypothetical protein
MSERVEAASLESKVKALAETHIPAMTRFGRFAEHALSGAEVFAIFGPVVHDRQAYVLITVTASEQAASRDLDAMLLAKVRTANLVMINSLREAGLEIAA